MVNFGRRNAVADSAQRIEPRRLRGICTAHRNGRQVGEILHETFGILDGEEIVVATSRVHPIAWRNHLIGSQRGDDIANDFFFVQAKLGGAQPVNVQLERRIIDVLRYEHVADAGQRPGFSGDVRRDFMGALQVVAGDLNVQRRGHSQIQNGVHKSAGLEIGGDLRQIFLQPRPHQIHVLKAAQTMSGIESDLDKRRVRAGIGRVDRGKPGRDTNVRNDDLQVLLRHNFADNLFHLLHQLVGEFDARAGRGFEIDDKLAGIGSWEIGFADERIKPKAQNKDARDAEHRRQRTQQRDIQHAFIAIQHAVEFLVEPGIEALKPAMRFRLPDF